MRKTSEKSLQNEHKKKIAWKKTLISSEERERQRDWKRKIEFAQSF